MEKIFIYRDDSNIFISARTVAAEREGEAATNRRTSTATGNLRSSLVLGLEVSLPPDDG